MLSYSDGGYSNNLPILDSQTITVSPFCGGADICPQDQKLENALWVSVTIIILNSNPGFVSSMFLTQSQLSQRKISSVFAIFSFHLNQKWLQGIRKSALHHHKFFNFQILQAGL